MAETYKRIYGGAQLGTSVSSPLFTVTTSHYYIIKSMIVCNTNDTTAYTFDLYHALSAESATTSNQIVNSVDIPAKGIWQWDGTMCLASGDKFYGAASTASQVTLTMWGVDVG